MRNIAGQFFFSADAASAIFTDLIGENVLGYKPELGEEFAYHRSIRRQLQDARDTRFPVGGR